MSSVIWRLKRNKRNQGNFLPNHSRLILETFITGIWWDYSPKQSDISPTDTSVCTEHCRAWHLHGLCEIWGELTYPGLPCVLKHVLAQGTVCFQSCPFHLEWIHLNIYMYFAPIVTRILQWYVWHKRAGIFYVDLNSTGGTGAVPASRGRTSLQEASHRLPTTGGEKHGEGGKKTTGKGKVIFKGRFGGCPGGRAAPRPQARGRQAAERPGWSGGAGKGEAGPAAGPRAAEREHCRKFTLIPLFL